MIKYAFESRALRIGRWSAAIFFGVVLHAGAVGVAFMQPEPEEAEGGGPIMIELAPMPVAPPPEDMVAPIGQLSHATAESVATPETVAKPVEKAEEAPVVPEAAEKPIDPDLEMAAKEPEKEEVEEKPEEPEKVVDEVERPPSEAAEATPETAPPPMEAERGEKVAAPAPGLSEADKKVIASWQKKVVVHLNGHKRYPPQARRKRIEGEVVVKFRIDRKGRVTASSLVNGSGAAILDDAAIEILQHASPLPVPPSQLSGNEFELTLPIRYQVM